MNKCPECFQPIETPVGFCPNCGARLASDSSRPVPSQRYAMMQQTKEPFITFVFVTSLVIMILLAILAISSLAQLPTLLDLSDIFSSGTISPSQASAANLVIMLSFVDVAAIVINFGIILCLFIISIQAKSKALSPMQRLPKANTLKTVCTIFVVTVTSMIVCEFVLALSLQSFANSFNVGDEPEFKNLMSQLYTGIGVRCVYIALAIAMMVKSKSFVAYLSNKTAS